MAFRSSATLFGLVIQIEKEMREYFSILVIVGGVAVVFFLWNGRPLQDSKINETVEAEFKIEKQSKAVFLDSTHETYQQQTEVSGTTISNLKGHGEYVAGESIRFCFEAADYSTRPELNYPTNKAAIWQWKKNHPWLAYLDSDGVSRLRRSVTSANFYSAAKEAKVRDINNGDNIEIWESLDVLLQLKTPERGLSLRTDAG